MLESIYGGEILELAKAANGAQRLAEPDISVVVHNPLCGDRVSVDLCARAKVVTALGHEVRGCALCEAAASWLGLHAPGQSFDELRTYSQIAHALLRREVVPESTMRAALALFEPVAAYRSRHRCVLLPFEALVEALLRLEGD